MPSSSRLSVATIYSTEYCLRFIAILPVKGKLRQNTSIHFCPGFPKQISGLGGFTDFSGSTVKARFFQEAKTYCSDQGRVMAPMNSTGKDSGYGTYASAEVQFKCVAASN